MGLYYQPPNPNIGSQQPLAPKEMAPPLLLPPPTFDPLYLTYAPSRVQASKPPARAQVSIAPAAS